MRFGLVSLYSFRPHVEHLYYVSTLLKDAGHELFFLTCDGALENCYARSIKGTSKIAECPACIAGGVRSYPVAKITSIKNRKKVVLNDDEKKLLSFSSACTLLRTEALEDIQSPEYETVNKSFHSSVEMAFENATRWIESNHLDGVICFNGRMDATRAIIYACERLAIPFMTLERPWFSDGLQFNPQGNCLSLKDVLRLNRQYKDAPLTLTQARYAAQLIASRFVRTNLKEWRAYNLNAERANWPVGAVAGLKALLLPSSRGEFQGHPEREALWGDYTNGFDAVLAGLNVPLQNIVLRCHPNWGEKIGLADGSNSERLYTSWAKEKGIHCIPSKATVSTFDLIQECDILIVNGSSAALEAGACGKKIICLGHSSYEDAGIAVHINGEDEMENLCLLGQHDPAKTIRYALRYAYTMSRRFAQCVEYVEAITPTRYRYYAGADSERIVKALISGKLDPDDDEIDVNDKSETEIVSMLIQKRWEELNVKKMNNSSNKPPLDIGRRHGLRWLDVLREKLPRGDLWHGK